MCPVIDEMVVCDVAMVVDIDAECRGGVEEEEAGLLQYITTPFILRQTSTSCHCGAYHMPSRM